MYQWSDDVGDLNKLSYGYLFVDPERERHFIQYTYGDIHLVTVNEIFDVHTIGGWERVVMKRTLDGEWYLLGTEVMKLGPGPYYVRM